MINQVEPTLRRKQPIQGMRPLCVCKLQKVPYIAPSCQCLAKLCPNIVILQNYKTYDTPSLLPTPHAKIQSLNLHIVMNVTHIEQFNKNTPSMIPSSKHYKIIAGTHCHCVGCGGIHSNSLIDLLDILNIPRAKVKTCFTSLHLSTIKSLSALIFNKHKLETGIG